MPTWSTGGAIRRTVIRSRGTAASSAAASSMLTATVSSRLIADSSEPAGQPVEQPLEAVDRELGEGEQQQDADQHDQVERLPDADVAGLLVEPPDQPLRGADRLDPADAGEGQADDADDADRLAAVQDGLHVRGRAGSAAGSRARCRTARCCWSAGCRRSSSRSAAARRWRRTRSTRSPRPAGRPAPPRSAAAPGRSGRNTASAGAAVMIRDSAASYARSIGFTGRP